MELVIVTVLFRAGDRVMEWARALERERRAASAAGLSLEVVAVDNGSERRIIAKLEAEHGWIKLMPQTSNVGFARGCNIAISQIVDRDALIVLLNPDVIVAEGFARALSHINWQSDLAAVGPRVSRPDGRVEQSARAFPSFLTGLFGRTSLVSRLLPNARLVRNQLLANPEMGVQTVDWVSGACMVIPTTRFRSVGLLDEGYWMYWEDADWCRRARNMGYRVEYHPEVSVTHHQGSSSVSLPIRTTVRFHQSALRYYRLHSGHSAYKVLPAGVFLAARCVIKLVLMIPRRARKDSH